MSYEMDIQEKQTLTGKITMIPKVDKTLTQPGHAADAKETGDAIRSLQKKIDELTRNS
jgi:hypothetical protein